VNIKKLIAALLGTGALALQTALSDGHMTAPEVVGVCVMLLGALAVYRADNSNPAWDTAKTWIHAVAAGAVVLQTAIVGGMTGQEWATIVIAILTTAGVWAVPNGPGLTSNGTGGTRSAGPLAA
jgi:hypothetical protein